MDALAEARLGQAPGVAPGRGGGDARRSHKIGDREEALRGEQIADDLDALSLAHGPGRFPDH